MAVSEINKRLRGIHGESLVAFCPCCRNVHRTYMLYTGKSRLPRVYCQSCKHNMEMHPIDDQEPYETIAKI